MFRRHIFCALASAFLVATSPLQAAPQKTLAMWDFDGTIIKGDCSEGLVVNGKTIYEGLVAHAIRAGFSPKFKGDAGVKDFFDMYEKKIAEGKTHEAYGDVARIFAGTKAKDLVAFCEKKFQELSKYYFARSMHQMRDLEKKGVESHIISASPELFVLAASKTVGLPKSQIHGVKVVIRNGVITDQIVNPLPYGEGKTKIMRSIEKSRHGKALYGFGNSYGTDGAFLLAIAQQGGKSTMINGGKARPGMTEHFICKTYAECVGD